MKELNIGVSGHRPGNLFGYNLSHPGYTYLREEFKKILLEKKPTRILSGAALGWDILCSEEAMKLKIPVHFYVPFLGQEKMWPTISQEYYKLLLNKAEKVIICSEGGYLAAKMQIRNQKIVDDCNLLIACYNQIDKGGTFNCLQYADKVKREIIIINPNNAQKEEKKTTPND